MKFLAVHSSRCRLIFERHESHNSSDNTQKTRDRQSEHADDEQPIQLLRAFISRSGLRVNKEALQTVLSNIIRFMKVIYITIVPFRQG